MALSRSDSRLQRWAVRAIAAFLVVYLLGAFGIPTFVPYVAVLLAVVGDGVRSVIQRRRESIAPREPARRDSRKETIH